MTLALRKFRKRDIPDLFSWFPSERDALQWAGAALSWPLKRREFIDLLKLHQGTEPLREVWAVERASLMLAHVQIFYNRRLRSAGLGRIAINPDHRGQHLAAPLMSLILAQAFRREWVHRVDLLVYSHNLPAIKSYETAGFILEGRRRETTPIGDEVWDTLIMSILRREFDKRTERE